MERNSAIGTPRATTQIGRQYTGPPSDWCGICSHFEGSLPPRGMTVPATIVKRDSSGVHLCADEWCFIWQIKLILVCVMYSLATSTQTILVLEMCPASYRPPCGHRAHIVQSDDTSTRICIFKAPGHWEWCLQRSSAQREAGQ